MDMLKDYIHWYTFYNDLQNLSSSEFGTCCALNRVVSILNTDPSNLKGKEAIQLKKTQKELMEKYCKVKKEEITTQEKESVVNLYKQLGLWKGE